MHVQVLKPLLQAMLLRRLQAVRLPWELKWVRQPSQLPEPLAGLLPRLELPSEPRAFPSVLVQQPQLPELAQRASPVSRQQWAFRPQGSVLPWPVLQPPPRGYVPGA